MQDSSDTQLILSNASYRTPLAVGDSYTYSTSTYLPERENGDYYLLFQTDKYQQQGETNENDNTRAVPIELLESDVDLLINDITAKNITNVNSTLSLEWTVQNTGTTPTTTNYWVDRIYFSTDEIFDSNDRVYTSYHQGINNSLNAGETYTESFDIDIPEVEPGNYFIGIVTDQSNQQIENNEANNTSLVPITVTEPPNLTVTNAVAPDSALIGNPLTVSWTVANSGSETAYGNSWNDRIYLSDDEYLDDEDRSIYSQPRDNQDSLESSDSYTTEASFSIPNTELGARFLLFVTDDDGNQSETDETDNVRAVPIEITVPDLVVSNATAPSNATLGETIPLSWTVTNSGKVTALNNWYDRVYISSDTTFDNSDTQLINEYIDAQTPLSADGNYTINKNVVIPSSAPGNYYLLFVTDQNNSQNETNETNNVKAVAINLSNPQISANNVTVAGTLSNTDLNNPTRGGTFADDYILNDLIIGNPVTLDLSAPFDAYLQLINADTGQVITYNDDYGGTLNSQLTFTPSSGINYLVRATSYSSGATGNYTLTTASTIPSDLIIETVTAPERVNLGETINLSWTVKNQSSFTASANWYDRIYLSSDTNLDGADTEIASEYIDAQTPLFSNANYTINKNVNISPTTLPGSRYLLFVTDRNNNQTETDETNNLKSIPINLIAPSLNLGQTITSTLAQNKYFSVNLDTDSLLYFDALTNDPSFKWSLTGADGKIVDNRAFTSSDGYSINNPVLNLKAGSYILGIDYPNTSNTYSFRLSDLKTANVLTPDTTVNNQLSPG